MANVERNMTDIICQDCGFEGISKCPYCRSIFFPEVNLLTQRIANAIQVDANKERTQVIFNLKPNLSLKDLLEIFQFHTLATQSDLKFALCNHSNVTFKPGCESTIGCGHGSSEVVPNPS